MTAVDLCDPARFAAGPPHDEFRRLRAEAPVCFLSEPGGPGFWGVFRHADVVEVSRHPDRFGSAPNALLTDHEGETGAESLLINTDPPRHTRLRKLVNRGFTPRQIAALEPRVRSVVTTLLDAAAAHDVCDLVTAAAAELPLQVIAELVGVPPEDRHEVFALTERMHDPDAAGAAADRGAGVDDARAAMLEMFAFADRLVQERAGREGDDLLSVLLAAEVDGERLTPLEIDLFFMLLMNAGSETTRNLVSGGVLALAEHPEQRARLLAEPRLVPSAVEEMLRWVTPVQHFRRTARADVELGGASIRRGDKVVMWYGSANRDEAVFDEPERFDVGRTPNEHVAFGAGGPHFCLGASLARLEARVLFEELLARHPRFDVVGPPRRLRSSFLNGITALPVRLGA